MQYFIHYLCSPALPLTIGEGAVAIVIAIASSIGHLEAALTNQIEVPHSCIRIATTMSPTTVSLIQATHAILSTCRRITFISYYRYMPPYNFSYLRIGTLPRQVLCASEWAT